MPCLRESSRVLIPIPQDISAPKRCSLVRSSFGLLIYENILINADSWKTLSRLLLLCKFFLHLKTVWVAPFALPLFDNYYWISFVLHLLLVFSCFCSSLAPALTKHVNKLIRLTSPCLTLRTAPAGVARLDNCQTQTQTQKHV